MKDQVEASPRRESDAAAPGSDEAPPNLRANPADRPDRPDRTNPTDRLAAEVQALSRLNDASSRLWHLSDLNPGLGEILSGALTLLCCDKGTVHLLGDDGALRIVSQRVFY